MFDWKLELDDVSKVLLPKGKEGTHHNQITNQPMLAIDST